VTFNQRVEGKVRGIDRLLGLDGIDSKWEAGWLAEGSNQSPLERGSRIPTIASHSRSRELPRRKRNSGGSSPNLLNSRNQKDWAKEGAGIGEGRRRPR